MPYQTINFSDVDSFEPLPGGAWYGVEIDHVEVRENKDGDALYLNWELVVIDGDYENRRLWMITSLKDTALFRLKQVFDSLDVLESDEIEIEYDDDIDPSTKSGPRLLYPEVEGMEASVFVKNEMYDGREQNRVTEMRGPNSHAKPKRKRSAEPEREVVRSRSRSRSRDDDYDDEEPRRRSSRREEYDEEDEAPRRRPARQQQRSRRRVR